MVPAKRGLKAYSQSCISLSLEACSRIPRCSVHTANVLGVWDVKHTKVMTTRAGTTTRFSFVSSSNWNYPQKCLFVFAVFDLSRREVDDRSLNAVSFAAVKVHVRPAHHHVTPHPAAGVWLQEVQIAFLWHDGTAFNIEEKEFCLHFYSMGKKLRFFF